jgi:coenzyme F420-0:L-glutamate ligase/coenzyme F420-1:gamma-L-glutamate ligase
VSEQDVPTSADGTAALRILPVAGIGRIEPGDDLVAIIGDAAPWLRDGDVLVVTSKIVSKAEGRLIEVPADGPEREAARVAAVRAETARTVAVRGATRIVATHHGFVLASAGIDASNVDTNRLVLLPKDPDASARALRAGLAERYGRNVAVIISDTMGRPWRLGLTDTAIGVAGIAPLQDYRGQRDPYGNELQLTVTAVVDELAGAADLVKGKVDQVPVAVVRGFPHVLPAGGPDGDGPGAVALVRDAASDLFPLGAAEARAAGMAEAARMPLYAPFPSSGPSGIHLADDLPDPQLFADALAGLPLAPSSVVRFVVTRGASTVIIRCSAVREPMPLVALGMDVQRLRTALHAVGLLTSIVSVEFDDELDTPDTESVAIAVAAPAA